MEKLVEDVRLFGSAVAILVGSCVMWVPLWLVGAGEVPQELVGIMTACALSLAGGMASYLRVPRLGAIVRLLCVAAGLALGWFVLFLRGLDLFADSWQFEFAVLGALTVGAIGMFVHAIWRPVVEAESDDHTATE